MHRNYYKASPVCGESPVHIGSNRVRHRQQCTHVCTVFSAQCWKNLLVLLDSDQDRQYLLGWVPVARTFRVESLEPCSFTSVLPA